MEEAKRREKGPGVGATEAGLDIMEEGGTAAVGLGGYMWAGIPIACD